MLKLKEVSIQVRGDAILLLTGGFFWSMGLLGSFYLLPYFLELGWEGLGDDLFD